MKWVAAILLCLSTLVSTVGLSSVHIPVHNRRDHLFDSKGLLYISTADGRLQRFDLKSEQLISSIKIGSSPQAIDLSEDGETLFVTELLTGASQAFLRKLNVSSGKLSSIPFEVGMDEGGSWDVVSIMNNRVLFTTDYHGSGPGTLRELDVLQGTVKSLFQVQMRTHLHRSADRKVVFGMYSNISDGPIFVLNALTGEIKGKNTSTLLNQSLATVNRDGSLIAYEAEGMGSVSGSLAILNSNLDLVEVLPTKMMGGVAFSATADILYAVDYEANEIVFLDTNTWQELRRIEVGEDVFPSEAFGAGVLSVDETNRHLALSTPSGVRVYTLQ